MFVVTVQLPNGQAVSRELQGGRCVVGRFYRSAPGAVDLQVADREVSNEHLTLCAEQGRFTIMDMDSGNGTYLANDRLEPHSVAPLQLGQQVSLGASLLTVTYTAGDDETRIATPPFTTKYVAVLYSDMVSGAQQNVQLGQDQAMELLLRHNALLRERFKRFRGKETKYTGDGFEAIFPTVNAALGCAAACQRQLTRENKDADADCRMHVRMGVNCGEAPTMGGRAYGLPLILAARVMSQAEAGQVLVPGHLLDNLIGTRYEFSSVGVRELKGMAKPVELFAFHWWRDPYTTSPKGAL